MSDEMHALQDAKTKIKALLEAAQAGSIVPIRLPRQIEEIDQLLQLAEEQQASALSEAAAQAGPIDLQAYMQEEAAFVGHAVHELNTPLTSIKGYSDMLGSMGELNDMQKQFLDVIKTNAARMQTLLSDFRYLNKVRKGVLKAEPKMDMFKNISMKLEKELTPLADTLNRKLAFDVPDGLPYVNLDTHLLGIAVTKLVENALRYSKPEGTVTISALGQDGDLLMKIADEGIGMSADELEQLGTVYFRSERDEVREHKGSGLGIPLAYGLIELIGGTYEVESELDKGTTFTIKVKGMS